MADTFDERSAVFTPAEASTLGVEYIREMEKQRHRAMPLDMPKIGNYLAPLMPGEVCGVQAQTSNYKSGFMNAWEHGLAQYLRNSRRETEIVIHVDTEIPVESLSVQEISRGSEHTMADLSRGNVYDWGRVIRAAGDIAGVQIYRITGALGRDNMPELYLSNIYRAIRYITSGQLTGEELQPACVFVDYLQALPIDPEVRSGTDLKNQRRLQVREDVYRLRRMAAHLKCPVVVGVQAKQVMSGHLGPNMLIPGMYDGEETSSIAQRFDRLISLWMPKNTHQVGETLIHKSRSFGQVAENMIFVRVLKQRGGLPAGQLWQCEIDFKTNRIQPTL
jgi:hypothetical protein